MAADKVKLKVTTKNKMRFRKNVPVSKPPQTATQGTLGTVKMTRLTIILLTLLTVTACSQTKTIPGLNLYKAKVKSVDTDTTLIAGLTVKADKYIVNSKTRVTTRTSFTGSNNKYKTAKIQVAVYHIQDTACKYLDAIYDHITDYWVGQEEWANKYHNKNETDTSSVSYVTRGNDTIFFSYSSFGDFSALPVNEGFLKSGDELINNTIKKLELLDISETDIQKLINTKQINKYMTLYAPMNGTVLMKYVIEGEKIMAGKQLMHIADLSRLWLKADIYESELSKVNVGSTTKINFSYLPAKTYNGKVTFIYPTVDPKTRIIQLRIDVPNTKDELKPAMFANVEIQGKAYEEQPVISETSIIRSGKKNIVILSLGEGKFKPVEVKLGGYSDGYYQVINGLNPGDKIVTSAQFMIDSESSLRAAVSLYSSDTELSIKEKMNSEMEHKHPDNNAVEHEAAYQHSEMEELEMTGENHQHDETESEGIIRKGLIDLSAIDKNKDGKVFQDFMDWNVISDKPGKCPICEMKLQEVSLTEAKENLISNGFKVK
ncbi:MAG: efflux RND transporter periplasmic adaptor subunit [Melioribacteraceae bacterium]|nr:MAG: efflux RND transporter periplasmic adaptor subunit [Melioribacteraceae bacterium]